MAQLREEIGGLVAQFLVLHRLLLGARGPGANPGALRRVGFRRIGSRPQSVCRPEKAADAAGPARVKARAADQHVAAFPAEEKVVTGAAVQDVGAEPAAEGVRQAVAGQFVGGSCRRSVLDVPDRVFVDAADLHRGVGGAVQT